MKIKLYVIGKIKEEYLKLGIQDYLTRIKSYAAIEVFEVKDEAVKQNASLKDIEKAKDIEGERILKLLKKEEYLIALDLNKKQYTSEEFAVFLDKKLVENNASISFVIGGSYGLSEGLRMRSNSSISLSNLTFTHQMSRLILLEQIYRAFKINNNETYHK